MELNRHTIVIKIKEIVEKDGDTKSMVGLASRVSYKGSNSNGITPELALSAIGGLLQAAGVSKENVDKHMESIGKDIIPNGKVCCDKKDAEKAKDESVADAAKAFARMMKDERWQKVMKNKTDIEMNTRGRKLCAWAATVFEIIERDSQHGKKSRDFVENLFLKEVAGIDDTDDK